MYQNCCKKCGSISLHTETKGNNVGLYCDDCGAWIKWLSKDELRAFEHAVKEDKKDVIECEIPLSKLCCFKPLDSDAIYFGHMAGKVIDNFENMTFMYVLMCDDRYFFSRKVIVKLSLEDLLNLFTDVVSPEDIMHAKIMAQISSAIAKERITLGMCQKEFAKYIHISHRTLSRIESGDYDISLKELSKIAVALDMDLNLSFTNQIRHV